MNPLARSSAWLSGLCCLPLAACGGDSRQPDEHRLLVIDGIEITLADVAPYVAFLDSFQPEGGRKTKVQYVLEQHVLPLFVARRAFAAERQEQWERAQVIATTATNAYELERLTAAMEHKRRSNMTRGQAKLPVAMFLFDPLRRGAVSPPLELPIGWFVVASFEFHESQLALDDYVDALQVGCVTHTARQWYEWFEAQKQQLADKATFVHPDYREAMPTWLRVPRQP